VGVLPWPELETLFHEVLARPRAERGAFLAERCAGRLDLQMQLEAMLRAHDQAGSALRSAVTDTQSALKPGMRLGSYEVVGELGAGGMGEVYRARDTRLGREVAIKILPAAFLADAERVARFEREARVVAALNHPNIAVIHGIERIDGMPALVLELVEGPTLADRIGGGPLGVEEALRIARQIAEALEAAHEKGIVHRDLKPANIKITPKGIVKVLDFGLATGDGGAIDLSGAPTITVDRTQAGVLAGTPAYMSPEQTREQTVTKQTDIWAFGCVLFEMLTGRPAFPGDTVSDTIAAVLSRVPDWPRLPETTPPGVRRLLQRCFEKDPTRRLHDIADARIEIDDAIEGLEPATASAAATPAHRRARLKWATVGVAGLAFAALAVVTALSIRPAGAPERVPTRFEIPTPPTVDPGSFALSADGRQLAFVATSDGVRRLFVRPFDQVIARPLRGTEGALFPFWAPDGRAVGFFAEGKLKRIDLPEGTPQVLADASSGWGGTWGSDGVIVFASGGPLLRVGSTGGQAVPVTPFRPESGDVNDCWPQFLPDGRRFLFFHVTNSRETTGVYVGSIGGGAPRRILTSQTMALYAPSGVLLQIRQQTLVALPFDAVGGVITEDPIPIAQGLGEEGFPPFRGAFAVAATGVLAYRLAGGERRRQLMWVDRGGLARGATGQPFPGYFISAELSPDGQRVAVDRFVSGNEDVWLFDVQTAVPTRFTFDPKNDWGPVWSADGRRVLFASNRNGVDDLFEKPASGAGEEQPLLMTPQVKKPLDWSKDGRFLLYRAQDRKRLDFDLWALPLMGERKPFPVVQTPFDEGSGQISPDGKWVAYTSNESGRIEVYAQSFPGPGGRRQLSSMGGTQLRWRPDGRELFYIAPDERLMAVPISVAADGQLEPGAPMPLFLTRISPYYEQYAQYSIARDGRFLMNVVVEAPTVPPVTVVLNWDTLLKR
jgi:eukaryotic-like serine/threonine-protein kinase